MALPQVGLEAVIANLGGFEAGAKAIVNAYNQIEKRTEGVVRASATLRDAEGNLVRFSVASGQAGAAMQQAGASFQQAIGKIASLALTLGVTRKLQEFATDSFTAARAQNDVRNALIQTVGGVDEYNNLIASAQQSTKGMVNETKLATAGLVFLKSGIAGSSEEVGRLSAAGTALVNTYSSLGASQEKLIRFILTGNRALLDNFNITQQQINAKIAEVEATTNLEGAEAKLEARKLLIIESGERLLTSISDETIEVQAAQAAWENFEAAFGQVLIALNQATGAIPMVTDAFNTLTEGAKAWQVILQEQIPAINELKSNIAEQAAQAAINAQTQEELAAAWEQGRTDFDGFINALKSGTDSATEYNAIVTEGTQGNYLLAQSLTVTEAEFNSFKESQEAARQAQADAVVTSGIWVSSLETMNMVAVDATTIQQALTKSIQDTATAQQVAAMGFSDMTNRQRAALEAMSLARARTPESQSAFARKEEERRRKEQEDAAKKLEKLNEKAGKALAKSFEEATRSIVSTIESVLQPTLDEVWTPPEGAEVRFDEAARRLATVSTEGFGSEWLQTLATQFEGADFFQPIIAAMEGGDPEALKNAATNILMNNITSLWDVEVIKQQVRQQLQQQQLRQQIIDQVKAELSLEGVPIAEETITPVTEGLGDIIDTVPPASEALTTLGTEAGVGQTALDTLGQTLGTVSGTEIPNLVTQTDELTDAIKTRLTTAWNTSLMPALRKVSDFIRDNLVVDFDSIVTVLVDRLLPNLMDFVDSVIPDFVTGMEGLDKKIKDVTSDFNELSTKVKGFTLPDVLTPGSPTPFETALIGIAEAAQQAAGGMTSLSNAIAGGNFDKLLGIDRSLVDPLKIAGAAFDDLEKHLEKTIGRGKAAFALKHIKTAIKANMGEILSSLDPKATIDEIVQHAVPNWEKVGIKLQDVAGVFWNSFKGNAAEAVATLKQMFIEGAQTAIGIGQKLTGVIAGAVDMLNSRIERLQAIVAAGGGEFEGKVLNAVDAQNLLNQALLDQAAIQDDILKTKEQESKLAFLQQQLDLFDMINQAGLDVGEVLGGLTLGLDASIPDLIAATNAVIEAMINQVNSDLGDIVNVGAGLGNALISGVTGTLGIASPSKVMKALADNAMGSFMTEMLSWGPAIAAGGARAIAGPTMVAAPVMAAAGGSQTTINANFGGNNISSGMSEAEFNARVLRAIQTLMR